MCLKLLLYNLSDDQHVDDDALLIGGDHNTTTASFYFRLTAPRKDPEHVQNAKSNSNEIERIHAR